MLNIPVPLLLALALLSATVRASDKGDVYAQALLHCGHYAKHYRTQWGETNHYYLSNVAWEVQKPLLAFIHSARLLTRSRVTTEILNNLEQHVREVTVGTEKNWRQLYDSEIVSLLEQAQKAFERAQKYDLTSQEEIFLQKLGAKTTDWQKISEGLIQGIKAATVEDERKSQVLKEDLKKLREEEAQLKKRITEEQAEVTRLQQTKRLPEDLEKLRAEFETARNSAEIERNEVRRLEELKKKGEAEVDALEKSFAKILESNTTGFYAIAAEPEGADLIPEGFRNSVRDSLNGNLAHWLEATLLEQRPEWEGTSFRIDVKSKVISVTEAPKKHFWSSKSYVLQIALFGVVSDPLHRKARSGLLNFVWQDGKLELDATSAALIGDFFERVKQSGEELYVENKTFPLKDRIREMIRSGLRVEEIQSRIAQFFNPQLRVASSAECEEALTAENDVQLKKILTSR